MAIICRKHKLLFIMVPATGCSALGGALLKELDGEWLPQAEIKRSGKTVLGRKHNALGDLFEHSVITRNELSDYLIFATIRNPFDRLASEYERLSGEWMESVLNGKIQSKWIASASEEARQDIQRRKEREIERARSGGFERWLRRRVTSRRVDRIVLAACKAAVTRRRLRGYISRPFPLIDEVPRLIRFENLQSDFDRVLRDAGIDRQIEIQDKNPTPGKRPYQEYYDDRARKLVERYWGREMAAHGYSF